VKTLLLWTGLLLLVAQQGWWNTGLQALFPGQNVVFNQTLLSLTLQHLSITGLAGLLVVLVGIPLAIWVSRGGAAFRPLVEHLVATLQTFPPVAVLMLALPIVGFGSKGVVLALFLYGLLPVVRNTLEGLDGLPKDVLSAAQGMGYTTTQQLLYIELPLATPVILAGVRTSLVLILATATVAPLIGGGGLGTPIVAGLAVSNLAYIIQGALLVALLALLVDYSLSQVYRLP
jgi:osmoprotectant transport system permease protein